MAQVTIQRYAAELGRLPPTCICCGQPAQQMVRHRFYYDPLWLIALGPVLGIFRYIWASQSINLFAPVCSRHGWRLGLPTYLGYFFAFTLLLIAPVLIASSQLAAAQAAMGWIWLSVFLYVLGMLALLLVVRLATPRLVDYDTSSITFGSVSLGFKAAITGQALPGHGLRSVGADAVFPAQVVPAAGTAQGAYAPGFGGSGLRAPATNNAPLVAILSIGAAVAAVVVLTFFFLGVSYFNRARRNAESRRMLADAQASHDKARAEAEARHAEHVAQFTPNSRRNANTSTSSATTPRPAPTTSPTSTSPTSTTARTPSSSASTSPTPFPSTIGSTLPNSTLPSSPASPPTPPSPPPAPIATNPPAPSPPPTIPDDPFGIGPQIGPPSTTSAGGIAPQRRPDLEAKAATEPIRGRFDKPDKPPGPDGRDEIVFETHLRDSSFPSASRPLTRVTDLRPGMEIWIKARFDNWYRGNVVGIDGLQAMIHIYGWDHDTDELVPISRIRVATGVDQPADPPPAGADPFADRPAPKPAANSSVFDDALPAKKRTWTDSSGKFKIEAEFVKLAAGQVTLKRTDGKEIALPLDLLAPADQAIAKRLAEQ